MVFTNMIADFNGGSIYKRSDYASVKTPNNILEICSFKEKQQLKTFIIQWQSHNYNSQATSEAYLLDNHMCYLKAAQ